MRQLKWVYEFYTIHRAINSGLKLTPRDTFQFKILYQGIIIYMLGFLALLVITNTMLQSPSNQVKYLVPHSCRFSPKLVMTSSIEQLLV